MKPGMQENRLLDGACIADAMVEADAETLAAAFGVPLKLAQEGKTLVETPRADISFFAAQGPESRWSVVEAVDRQEEPTDHIVTLLKQALAAMRGQVLDLPLSYENGLGLAQRAARTLGTRALVVWGSDEWSGLGGGAMLDAAGKVVRACSVASLDEMEQHLRARESMIAGEEEIDVEPGEPGIFVYQAGRGISQETGQIIEFLDTWLKEVGAAEPMAPPSLWGVWEDYREVWGAIPKG